jgi:hypothetical protein
LRFFPNLRLIFELKVIFPESTDIRRYQIGTELSPGIYLEIYLKIFLEIPDIRIFAAYSRNS